MQSDGNGYYGAVVLDSSNMVYRDKDSILDQNMKIKFKYASTLYNFSPFCKDSIAKSLYKKFKNKYPLSHLKM